MNDTDTEVTVDEFFKLTPEKQLSAVEDGTFVPPSKKSDPAEAEKFEKLWSESKTSSAPEKVAAPVKEEVKPVVPSAPEKAAEEKKTESAPEKVATRFKSLDEAETAIKEKETLINKQQEIIQKLNNVSSTDKGRASALQKKLDEVTAKIGKETKPVVEEEFELPEAPEPPDPKAFEEQGGINSEEYLTKQAQYNKDVSQYNKKMRDALKLIPELKKKNSELEAKVQKVDEFMGETVAERSQTAASETQTEFERITGELQSELGLSTVADWKQINNAATLANDSNATPEAKEAAKNYLAGLPKADLDNFNKLSKAVQTAVDFSAGKPRLRFEKTTKSYKAILEDAGFTFKPAPASVDLEALHQKHEANKPASGIDPTKIGQDEVLSNLTRTEKTERYSALLDEIEEMFNDGVCSRAELKKTAQYQERQKLGRELGYIVD